ncbi:MAG: pyridoxal-phosphate dependent enzyme, partial [Alphaproteobacteria bacterium]|nr:pyridoxal-phosphate dependent enzyme [Alphaproteobacteria bacterium]
MQNTLPTYDDVRQAGERLNGLVRETPVLRADALDELAGARLFIKAECLQETGSFKLRGASNRLLQMSETERRNGVVAFSSGNHAQGIARAAKRLGMPALIVMPSDAPKVKSEGVLADGAEIYPYERNITNREEIAEGLARERGAVLVPSYDDPMIMA